MRLWLSAALRDRTAALLVSQRDPTSQAPAPRLACKTGSAWYNESRPVPQALHQNDSRGGL